MPKKKLTCPKSETNITINALGLLCFLLSLVVLNWLVPEWNTEDAPLLFGITISGNALMTVIGMLCLAAPILIHDIFFRKIHQDPAANLGEKQPLNKPRIAIKLVGLYATLLAITGVYWLFPEYKGDWYERVYAAMALALPFIVLSAPFYFAWVDRRQLEPEDSYYHLGRLILFRQRDDRTRYYLAEHIRNWMVKAFFLPLMFTFLANNIRVLGAESYTLFKGETFSYITNVEVARRWYKYFFDFMETFIYTVDVAVAAVGYAMTYRGINGQIRSVEPTTLGWIVCLICYPPFWNGLFFNQYFNYDDNVGWGSWLWDMPIFYMLWGSIGLALLATYSWATVAMGYRFSNLTYRGLITSGPYRVTKHPAYITKNLFFWLVSLPFLSHESWDIALQHCLLLLGVNLIYYTRARTEERHLLNYPEYQEYCEWMDEHGWLRGLKRFSCFSWRTSQAVGVKVWWRQGASK